MAGLELMTFSSPSRAQPSLRAHPTGEPLAKDRTIFQMRDAVAGPFQHTETFSVRRAIYHTGIRAVLGNLLPSGLDRVLTGAVEFVFPADNPALREKRTQLPNDFRGRFQREGEFSSPARDFGGLDKSTVRLPDLLHLVITKSRHVENRRDILPVREAIKFVQQIIVGGKGNTFRPHELLGATRRFRFETGNFPAGTCQPVCEHNAELARGLVGQPPYLVNRFKTRSAGDDNAAFRS